MADHTSAKSLRTSQSSLTYRGRLFLCSWEGFDLSFTMSANLEGHHRLHEKWDANPLRGSKGGADGRFTCLKPGCGELFKYPSLLQTHTKIVHGFLPGTQAVCMWSGCGEVFDSLSQLKAHTKAAHCFVVCKTCGVSILKNKLKVHAHKHGGRQALMRCPHLGCLHSYNKKSNLNTHIRIVHMDLKPYACGGMVVVKCGA